MKNAHLRVGCLIFKRYSEKINASTNVQTFCDRYIGDESQLHLVSFFGWGYRNGRVLSRYSGR